MALPDQVAIRNRLLAAIPEHEFQLLSAELVPVGLTFGEPLHRHGDLITHLYFPEDGFVSAMTVLSTRGRVGQLSARDQVTAPTSST